MKHKPLQFFHGFRVWPGDGYRRVTQSMLAPGEPEGESDKAGVEGVRRGQDPRAAFHHHWLCRVDAITGVLAKELAARNIRVNSVDPGATLSEGTKAAGLYGVGSEFEKQLVARTPLGRIGTPADIAKVVAFLASDDSGWLTGEIIPTSGGQR